MFTGPVKSPVFNREIAPSSFLTELIDWARSAPDELFAPNDHFDIYSKVKAELGPWTGLLHRKAVMLEVMRVLAGFESSWNWTEGVDTSKSVGNTAENAEAGAWQMSYDARKTSAPLAALLVASGIHDGIAFQHAMKTNHLLAMEAEARLLRDNTKHNGPLYKGDERKATWPTRPSLWDAKESIYPWLSRDAVAQFQTLLA
jgi:hypothetical protein